MAKTAVKVQVDPEPSYSGVVPVSESDISRALNWYARNKTTKDAAKILGCDSRVANPTLAWMLTLKKRGFIFDEKNQLWIAEAQRILKTKIDEAKKETVEFDEEGNVINNVVNIQERIANRTNVYIGELEGMLDEYGVGEKEFNAYEWFQKNEVKPVHATGIIDYFEKRLENFNEESSSKKNKEYYEGLSKKRIKSIRSVMETIINDATRLGAIKKTRKTRKAKVLSHDKIVKNLKYLKNHAEFKLQSINPELIIGAEHLWVFNVKTRKLGLYVAKNIDGLNVKGSSILNFTETSVSKTVRKPEKVLTDVLNGTKVTLRKLMDSINSKPVELNGRINKDTVLLRIVK